MARQRQFYRQFLVSAVDIDVVQLRIWELGAMARDELAGDQAPGSVDAPAGINVHSWWVSGG